MQSIWILHSHDLFPQLIQLFAEAGVMAIEHADFEGIERLAAVTGGEIVSTFDNNHRNNTLSFQTFWQKAIENYLVFKLFDKKH